MGMGRPHECRIGLAVEGDIVGKAATSGDEPGPRSAAVAGRYMIRARLPWPYWRSALSYPSDSLPRFTRVLNPVCAPGMPAHSGLTFPPRLMLLHTQRSTSQRRKQEHEQRERTGGRAIVGAARRRATSAWTRTI